MSKIVAVDSSEEEVQILSSAAVSKIAAVDSENTVNTNHIKMERIYRVQVDIPLSFSAVGHQKRPYVDEPRL